MPPSKPSEPTGHRLRRPGWGLLYLLVLVGILLVSNYFYVSVPSTLVPYSQFMDAVEKGRVGEAVISQDDISWTEGEGDELVHFRASRVPDVSEETLLERLRESGAKVTGDPPHAFWGLVLIWLLPLALLVLVWSWMLRRGRGQAEAVRFGRSRARLWEEGTTQVTFKDAAGVDEAVDELREVVDFLKNPGKYTEIGAHIPKGVILVGPPGTGKTLLARATAGEASVPFFTISGADFVEMFVGVGAARARDLFRQARDRAPCIVFIDELDALGRRRAEARAPITNEEREQTLNQLLVEIDGFDSSVGVIIMAATNRPDLLDPALLRPGRFDRQIVVDKPDLRGREAILNVHARPVKFAPDVDLHVIASRTPGFAGAELANVINEAALLAVRRGRTEVTMGDLDEAVDRVLAGLERKSRALIPKERKIVAHHEMGHALMGMLLPHADPVHKVSIVPRGAAALGATIQAPLEDRYLLTEAELHDRLTVVLGGRAAEDVVFGEISTGAADDLQQATALARRMVTQFGMSKEMGPVALEDIGDGPGGLPFVLNQPNYSDETARKIDAETRRIILESFELAKSILRTNKEALLTLSAELLESEVLDGDVLAARLDSMGIRRITVESAPLAASDSTEPNGRATAAKV